MLPLLLLLLLLMEIMYRLLFLYLLLFFLLLPSPKSPPWDFLMLKRVRLFQQPVAASKHPSTGHSTFLFARLRFQNSSFFLVFRLLEQPAASSASSPAPVPAPGFAPAAIAQITSMGFSDVQARQALSANGHIIEASINWSFNVSFQPFVVPKLILCPLFDTRFL